MKPRFGLLMLAVLSATPVQAQTPSLDRGLAGALKGCELWVLEPASWARGTDAFVKAVGLGPMMGLVSRIDDHAQPPPPLRVANHYWRINATPTAGFILVVSDRLPMCHITGGGGADLQPIVERLLASETFKTRWTATGTSKRDDMISTTYSNKEEPGFAMTISRADKPDQRRDRVQILATATMQVGD